MPNKPFPPPPRRRPWWLALPPLLLAAHAALWWLAADRLEAGAQAWVAARRAEGWLVSHGPPERGGWPLAATLRLPALRLQPPGAPGWQAEALALRLSPAAPATLELEALGPQALLLGAEALPVRLARLAGTVGLRDGAARLTAEAPSLTLPAGPLAARRISLDWAPPGWQLAATGLTLPVAAPALGAEVQRLEATLVATPPLPLPPGRAAAAAWQRQGGTLRLPAFALAWGPLSASGEAELALDAALQPSGRAALRLRGLDATLEALGGTGLLPARNLGAARVMLALLQRPDPAGGPPQLDLPLALAGRRLTLAGFQLGQLPVLDWPLP